MGSVSSITNVIAVAVANSVNFKVRGLMMHEYSLLNKHFIEVNGSLSTLALLPPLYDTQVWMSTLRLPPDLHRHPGLIAVFVGSKGSGIKPIEASCNCKIRIVENIIPHIHITGHNASKVSECHQMVNSRLVWAMGKLSKSTTVEKESHRGSLEERRVAPSAKRQKCESPQRAHRNLILPKWGKYDGLKKGKVQQHSQFLLRSHRSYLTYSTALPRRPTIEN
jgi:hypothetical protein